MRLGLEPLSPRMSSQGSAARRPSSRASAFSPIDVDGDSTDDAEPPSALSPVSTRPSFLDLRAQRTMELRDDSSDESEKKSNDVSSVDTSPKKSALNFFFNAGTSVADRSTPKKRSRNSFSYSDIRARRVSSVLSSPSKDEPHEVISATRTNICGEKYDRCELDFGEDRVMLTLWKADSRKWEGHVKYAHMGRFCFSRVDRPPYILLLQMDKTKGRSRLAEFYDSVFARICSQNNDLVVQPPKVYGVVFYFDEQMDYMRCQSMGDSNPKLARLLQEKLSESEVRDFSKWDVVHKSRLPRRELKRSTASSSPGGHILASLVGNGAKRAIGSVRHFFRPVPRPSVLEDDENLSVVRDHAGSNRARTLDLSRESNGLSVSDVGEEKTPIQVDDASSDKRNYGFPNADNSVESAVTIQNTPDESGRRATLLEASTASPLRKEEGKKEKVESKKRAASSRREDERLKRRRIESRRNEVLLTYPYDGSDTSGRISVTLGDVDRLVPGEFLNDNIIDFYLRFLWRHLESWQQQQMYFFTSHFFTQLNGTNGTHELATADPDERFARVARWTQKETNLFDKRFLFIPINDSFHWSVAVFCNPGSAIIKKHRKIRRRRPVVPDAHCNDKNEVVDLVDGGGDNGERYSAAVENGDGSPKEEEVEEEEVPSCQEDRRANPPCLLFLDSLRCHRKKKFTKMLRNYLECEWKARFASRAVVGMPTAVDKEGIEEEEVIVTTFDSESIHLVEPNIPLQSNSSDCGVFLLMYAASIVRLFPAGMTREELESNLTSTLSTEMFRDEHVLEFREYLQQLLFCLQFLEKNGLPEEHVKQEELETFTID
ncbi:hypothetical protein PRIC2_005832 [Phytophthora ramorum]